MVAGGSCGVKHRFGREVEDLHAAAQATAAVIDKSILLCAQVLDEDAFEVITMPHYCKICGEYKSSESFSGGGHARHICRKCAKLPVSIREERMTLNQIYDLPFCLNKGQRIWLEKAKSDPREKVRDAAEDAWNLRFVHRETPPRDDDEEELLLGVFGSPDVESEPDWNPEYSWLLDEGVSPDPDWVPPEDYDFELPF